MIKLKSRCSAKVHSSLLNYHAHSENTQKTAAYSRLNSKQSIWPLQGNAKLPELPSESAETTLLLFLGLRVRCHCVIAYRWEGRWRLVAGQGHKLD
jgi:hypothetical protein